MKLSGAETDSVAKNFKLIKNKHILKSSKAKHAERALLFSYKIYLHLYYTFNFDELKVFATLPPNVPIETAASPERRPETSAAALCSLTFPSHFTIPVFLAFVNGVLKRRNAGLPFRYEF